MSQVIGSSGVINPCVNNPGQDVQAFPSAIQDAMRRKDGLTLGRELNPVVSAPSLQPTHQSFVQIAMTRYRAEPRAP
jgi:hypothetical protein